MPSYDFRNVFQVVCGGVVGGEWRQETGLACDDTLNLDFSGPEPQVDCSSPCEDSVKVNLVRVILSKAP